MTKHHSHQQATRKTVLLFTLTLIASLPIYAQTIVNFPDANHRNQNRRRHPDRRFRTQR